jgi:hypothetical protein
MDHNMIHPLPSFHSEGKKGSIFGQYHELILLVVSPGDQYLNEDCNFILR